jgi:molybdenum cofactor cytidylyltransferase
MGAPSRPDLVLLAAGRSSRMGEPKGLVVIEGRRWIDRQLDAVAAAGVVDRVVVVLGHDRSRYDLEAPGLRARAAVVENPNPDLGPFSSLQCGLAALDAPAHGGGGLDAVFVLPVDVPAPGPEVWRALAGAVTETEAPGSAQAAVPVHDGRGGHPVFLARAFARRLLAAPPESRLDLELAHAFAAGHAARVPVADPRVRLNLNAPGDWVKLRGKVD